MRSTQKYTINFQKLEQDANIAFWRWQNMASEAIECYGVHNLPNTKKEAISLFSVNLYFSELEIDDEKAQEYLHESNEGKTLKSALKEVKSLIKKELKRYFLRDMESKLSELYNG